MRYWYRVTTGKLTGPYVHAPAKGNDAFALTSDIADLPGPLPVCRWDGTAVVVDTVLLDEMKARLRYQIEDNAVVGVQESVLTTPWGDFRVRRDDIDAYQMIAFSAIYAIQTSGPFSMTLRKVDGSTVDVTAAQYMRFMALIGDRMAARMGARDTKLGQLAGATAEQLKGFAP